MDINDVLLTDEEIKQVYRKEKFPAIFNFVFEGAIAKAAQLKLLNMLKQNYQLPKDTIVYPNLLVMSGQQVDELEKLLKEAKNG
jgi:hypothetical protein